MKSTRQARPQRHDHESWGKDPESQLRSVFCTSRIIKGNATFDAMQALWFARDKFKRAPLHAEDRKTADSALRDLQLKLLAAGVGDDLATATA